MVDFVHRIVEGLESLKGKEIEISKQGSITRGIFKNFKHKEYFYELLLLKGNDKKRVIIYYPFSFSHEDGIITFDYRLHKLKKRCPLEQVYNVLGKRNHQFLNNIITIYEVRPNSELS